MKDTCIDVYTDKEYRWFKDYSYKIKGTKTGSYYTFKVDKRDKKKILRRARSCHLRTRVYDANWERSGEYRKQFIEQGEEPYRCRYCRKWLTKDTVQIDHLIPIGQAKKNSYARLLLKIRGIKNVNDIRNLVPSCRRCNLKKGDKLGIWYVKGLFGKYRLFWIIYYIVMILVSIALIYLAYAVSKKVQTPFV